MQLAQRSWGRRISVNFPAMKNAQIFRKGPTFTKGCAIIPRSTGRSITKMVTVHNAEENWLNRNQGVCEIKTRSVRTNSLEVIWVPIHYTFF